MFAFSRWRNSAALSGKSTLAHERRARGVGQATSRRRLTLESLESRQLMAADLVLQWNDIALDAIRADRTAPPIASRGLAILHTAIYDAVNAIEPTHATYKVSQPASPIANKEAAVVGAAHTVLVSLFPQQASALTQKLQASLAAIPDGAGEILGLSLGRTVAATMLGLRAGDGSAIPVSYSPKPGAGEWQPTPPAHLPALLPQWGDVKPFGMADSDQFTPHNIPALSSTVYAAAFNEVKELGSATSAVRTADQTQMARFWANGAGTATPPGHWNEIGQAVSQSAGLSLSQNARLFAALNVALADAAIMAWDAKYDTHYWRPITGIRQAGIDGNAATTADPTWTPLLDTPNFPSYVSGHASFSGAGAAVLAHFFGTDNVAFTLASESPGVANRSFGSFSQAAKESADSRLYAGIHWRFDNDDGLTAGRAIGQYVVSNYFAAAKVPTAVITGNQLVVQGSDKNDMIQVIKVGSQIQVMHSTRGRLGTFAASAIQSISVDAGAGNDLVQISANIFTAVTIHGGQGNDTLIGGSGHDKLFGDDGDDFLFGMAGNDTLDGGFGLNYLYGGWGNDTFAPSKGKDRKFQ